ncbi:hypothetical protein PAA8504_00560 [Palleronia abyssalis]|uniref:Uncharacterized protein n=1 Tax=Palleronia abyssalis TaxID=1501240 RepID=A0A2R8BRI6_9RHOB|nr:hypothetical protein PAA8504_00560 [Palleronia abyssalis]
MRQTPQQYRDTRPLTEYELEQLIYRELRAGSKRMGWRALVVRFRRRVRRSVPRRP